MQLFARFAPIVLANFYHLMFGGFLDVGESRIAVFVGHAIHFLSGEIIFGRVDVEKEKIGIRKAKR